MMRFHTGEFSIRHVHDSDPSSTRPSNIHSSITDNRSSGDKTNGPCIVVHTASYTITSNLFMPLWVVVEDFRQRAQQGRFRRFDHTTSTAFDHTTSSPKSHPTNALRRTDIRTVTVLLAALQSSPTFAKGPGVYRGQPSYRSLFGHMDIRPGLTDIDMDMDITTARSRISSILASCNMQPL
ncbi:hypothetical protein HRR83_006792 [Exophiala dermatitidis]|nr:hypothetical protein HRR84_007435 [Exophiala dermatitidis]KAJ4593035.1 hypothetical protein HRR83_006792 [Exophiala dermatitidis]KAJ4614340.1 hypothetical protein HRR88_007965 [Exophiala dermatitidis]KAJ4641995.1 hypothetical protein HRR89_003868 [Exophiala dermatitidis]KAJ4642184.1 hypothetical protein HRR91_007990 [Exophiala dermatitidis]